MRWLMRSMAVPMVVFFPCIAPYADSKLPLTLTINAPPPATVGEDIKIPAVLKNVSAHMVRISNLVHCTIIIHDEHGKVPTFKSGDWSWGGSFYQIEIEPGKTSTEYVDLMRYDLAPGKYIVRVKRPVYDAGYPKGAMLDSNEITIAVLPRKADGA